MKKIIFTFAIVIVTILQSFGQSQSLGWRIYFNNYFGVSQINVHPVKGNPSYVSTSWVSSDNSLQINAVASNSGEYQFLVSFYATNINGEQGYFTLYTSTKSVDLSIMFDNQWLPSRADSDIEFNASGANVFYINTDRRLSVLYKSGTSWGNGLISNIRTNSGKGLVRNPVNNDLYFVGSNNKIHRAFFINGSWQTEVVSTTQWNNVHTDSKLQVNSNGTKIFYINSNSQICHLYKHGLEWKDARLNNHTVSSGRSFIWSDLDNCVYFIKDDGKIYKTYYTAEAWWTSLVSTIQWNNAHSDTELVQSTGGNNVFYINSNNQVCNLYKSGSEWRDARLTSLNEAKAKSTSNLVWSDGGLYYTGLNNYVCKLYFKSGDGWQFEKPSPHMALPNAGSGVNIYDGVIYFTGTDNKMHYLIPQTARSNENEVIKSITVDNKENIISACSTPVYFNGRDSKIQDLADETTKTYEVDMIKTSSIDIHEDVFSIYPNPVSESLFFKLPIIDTYTFQLIDVNGKIVHEKTQYGQKFTIDCSNYLNGVYLIRVSGNDNIYQKKVIIQQ